MDAPYVPSPSSALCHWQRGDGLFTRPGADRPAALVFIHGFAGSPDQFNLFYDRIPDGIAAYSVLLPGHGGAPRDVAASTFEAWRNHVYTTLATLAARHEALYLVGHSMGALFALEFHESFPKIRGLFLMQIALRFAIKPVQLLTRDKRKEAWEEAYGEASDGETHREDGPARHTDAAPNADPDAIDNATDENTDNADAADNTDNTETADAGGLVDMARTYLGMVPNVWGLYGDALHVRRELERVKIPCVIIQSAHDELLSTRLPELLKQIPGIRVRVLPESTHHLYSPKDTRTLQRAFERMTAWILDHAEGEASGKDGHEGEAAQEVRG